MELTRAIELLEIERECVTRDCDRDCANCELVQDRDELVTMYNTVIAQMRRDVMMKDDMK